MKKALFTISTIILLLGILASSCRKDFLEKPFSVTFNEDSVFAKNENAQKLVVDMYALRPYYMELYVSAGSTTRLAGSLLESATDAGCSFRLNANYGAHKFNFGTVDAEWLSNNPQGEDVYGDHYKTIRKAFTLIERIDEVPDAPSSEKERIKAEAKTMIAFQYYELIRRYGGVPLVTHKLNPQLEDVNLPRARLIDVYDYIIKMLDEAIAVPDFAARYDGVDFGRLSKAFAYGLKARAALLIASPLFNSATPYMDFGANNELICLMSYEPQRWEVAARYAEEAITFCEANGYSLVNTANTDLNYTISYQYRPNAGNTEMIWATMGITNPTHAYWIPRGAPFSGGYSANLISLNLVEKYQNKDGSYIDWNNEIRTPANDPTAPYKNLDPRFHQSVMFNGLTLYTNATIQYFEHETPSKAGNNSPTKAKTQFSHQVRKHVYGYEDRPIAQKTWQPMCSQMRLTDLYMIYAEALNETMGAADSRVVGAINKIRSRSGMPDIPAGLSRDEMRSRIQDEWAIEFAFEDYRFFDLKRWKLGEVFKGPIYDVAVKKWNDNTFTYTKYKYEDRPFYDWYYLHPLPPSEVNLQYGLVQNPGW